MKYILLFLVLIIGCTQNVLSGYTDQECRELGFIKGQLMCSNCEKLSDFGLEPIKTHCKECCTMDQLPAIQRAYPKAILEVCTCKYRAYPQIEAFIKSGRPAKFPNLQIKFVRGLDPIVKLLDKSGNVKETLSISKWNTDAVEEFFETHLQKQGTEGKSAYGVIEDVDDNDDYLETNNI